MKYIYVIVYVIAFSMQSVGQTAFDYFLSGDECFYNFDNPNYTEAIKFYNKAIELDPEYVDAYYQIAACYERQSNYESALNTYNTILPLIKHDSSNYKYKVYFNMGDIYTQIGSSYETKQFYEIEEYEKNKDEINRTISLREKYYKYAIENYQNAFASRTTNNFDHLIFQNLYTLFNNIGNCYFDLKDYDKAIENYNSSLKYLNKKDISYKIYRTIAWESIGDCYKGKDENKKAIEWYTKVLNDDSKNINVIIKLGDIYYYKNNYKFAKKQYEDALSLIEKEIKDNPNSYFKSSLKMNLVYINKNLGLINMSLKNYYAAESNFTAAFNIVKTKQLRNLLIQASVIFNASLQGWVPCLNKYGEPIISSAKEMYFYNPKKVKNISKSIKQVWLMSITIPIENLSFEDSQSNNDESITESAIELTSRKYATWLTLDEMDCTNDKGRSVQFIKYDSEGNIIDSYSLSKDEIKWDENVPNSIGEALFEFVCNKK